MDDDLRECLTQGDESTRRRYAYQLANNNLTREAYNQLAICRKYVPCEKNQPDTVTAKSMSTAHKMIGHVFSEVVATDDLDMPLSTFLDRIRENAQVDFEQTQLRIYTLAAARLLALHGVLQPIKVGRGKFPFTTGSLSAALKIFDVGPRDWLNQKFTSDEHRIVYPEEILQTMASMSSQQLRIATGGRVQKPPKVEIAAEAAPPPLPADGVPLDDLSHEGLTLYNQSQNFALEAVKRDVWLKENLEGLQAKHNQLQQQFNSLCAALQWKPPA